MEFYKAVLQSALIVIIQLMSRQARKFKFIEQIRLLQHLPDFVQHRRLYKLFNPLTARIFTVFGQFIRGLSVTQRSMGCEAPRYPPQYPGP